MNLTKDEAVRLFREHWKWLVKTGGNSTNKEQWLTKNGYEEVRCNCFLCEYTEMDCENCLVVWDEIANVGEPDNVPCEKSYFEQWKEAEAPEERKRLAKIISELPEKEV